MKEGLALVSNSGEMLVLVDVEVVGDRLAQFRVPQRVSPRVFLVSGAARDDLQALEGVLAVLEPGATLPDELRRTLTESETLFADAFARRAETKQRPGEGLSWDAEGFEPPDPPHRP